MLTLNFLMRPYPFAVAGAVAKVSLGGSLAGLRIGVQIDACGAAVGRQKCLSDVSAGPVDVISHVFYIGNACGRRRALGGRQPEVSAY